MSIISTQKTTKIIGQPHQGRSVDGQLVYAVGDIHGCYDLLRQLLAKISCDAANRAKGRTPRLIFCGDYIDRGPDTSHVLDALCWLKRHRPFDAQFLMGNHEEVFLAYLADPISANIWMKFGGYETLRSYGVSPPEINAPAKEHQAARDNLLQRMPIAHLRFIEELQLMIGIGDYAFVHAGASDIIARISRYVRIENDSPEPLDLGDVVSTTLSFIRIVDDDEESCSEIASALMASGYDCSWANSPEFTAAPNEPAPDILILDLSMPRLDGFQVIQNLADAGRAPHLIIASGHEQRIIRAAVRSAEEAGLHVLGALEKPYSIASLLALVEARLTEPGKTVDDHAALISHLVETQALIHVPATERRELFAVSGTCYEIYAITKDGKRAEVYFNPVTGAVVQNNVD